MKEIKEMLAYNTEEGKWQCLNCGATYCPEEVKRVWDYAFDPVPEEMEDSELCEVNFIPCHCMDCGIKWEYWFMAGVDA